MSTQDVHLSDEEDANEQYIEQDEILAEIEGDDDHPMEEDDDVENDIDNAGSSDFVGDTSEQHFPEHKGSVFAVSAHPTAPLAVSGGEDDLGYIWDITDGEVIAKLTGHTDSVSSAAFSNDGELVSTGGMDGKVRIWRRVGKENYRIWEFFTELQGPDEVMVRSVVLRYIAG
jgi:ribosome assembly protein SQT1